MKITGSITVTQSRYSFVSLFMLTALFVSGLFFVFRPQLLQASNLNSAKFPHYKIEVSYDHDKTLLVGKMQVRFSRKAYPHDELLFALPGNRFLVPDERGIRKHKIVPVFSQGISP